MKIETIIQLRNFGIALIFLGAISSLISGLFVSKDTALSILLWPLFVGFFIMFLVPLFSSSKECPNCKKRFFGNWLSIDLITSKCKSCGYSARQ
jgi:hypothetical protein